MKVGRAEVRGAGEHDGIQSVLFQRPEVRSLIWPARKMLVGMLSDLLAVWIIRSTVGCLNVCGVVLGLRGFTDVFALRVADRHYDVGGRLRWVSQGQPAHAHRCHGRGDVTYD